MDLDTKVITLRALKDKRAELNKKITQLGEDIKELEGAIIHEMENNGLSLARTGGFTVSLSSSKVPIADDWDSIYNFILDTQSPYLLERRIAVKAWRELGDSGVLVPGTSEFVKTKVNLRKAPKGA